MKILSCLLISLCFSSIGWCQDFAPVGSKWFYSQWSSFNPTFESYSTIESVKDTVVASQGCRKMQITLNNNLGPALQTVFMYGINKKIFYYSTDSLRFLQLYDFNKEVNDSFNIEGYYSFIAQGVPLKAYVDSVDTVEINAHLLKRIYTHTNDGLGHELSQWSIEGIGNLFWMFPWGDDFTTGPLRCYEDSNLGLYETGAAPACDFVSSVNEVSEAASFSVFPNPAHDLLSINTSENNFQNSFSISIRNFLGQLVLTKTFSAGENMIDVNQLASGIYFLEIHSSDGSVVRKFEKQ